MNKYYICIIDFKYTILKSINEYENKIIKANTLRLWKLIEEKDVELKLTDNESVITINKYKLKNHFKEVTYINNLELSDKLNKTEVEKIEIKEKYDQIRNEYDYLTFIKNGIENLLPNVRIYNNLENKNSVIVNRINVLGKLLEDIKKDIPTNLDILFELREECKENYLNSCIDYREILKKIEGEQ